MMGNETKATLEKGIGLSLSQIYELDVSSEIDFVQAKTKKRLIFAKGLDSREIVRGNPLLAQKKIATIEEINAKIDALRN